MTMGVFAATARWIGPEVRRAGSLEDVTLDDGH
jgi:hypothetical protein